MQDGHTFEILRKTQIVDISDLVSYGVVEFDASGSKRQLRRNT